MAADASPKRRSTDQGWRARLPERFYRDVWLLAITALVLWALISIQNQRWNNVYDACQGANGRYLNTLRIVDAATATRSKVERERAKLQRNLTLAFIAALAPPHFDHQGRSTCHALADKQVRRWP